MAEEPTVLTAELILRGHAMTAGLRQSTHTVHHSSTQANDEVRRTDQHECFLLLDRSVSDRPQDLWIKSGVACKLLRIYLIARKRPGLRLHLLG